MAGLYTEMHRHVLDVFNEYDVQILTPSYSEDPHERKVVPQERWHSAPARPAAPGTIQKPTDIITKAEGYHG